MMTKGRQCSMMEGELSQVGIEDGNSTRFRVATGYGIVMPSTERSLRG